MAVIHEKTNSLIEKKNSTKANSKVLKILIILNIILLFVGTPITILTIIGTIVYASTGSTERKIYQKGIEGEEYGLRVLKELDDSYHIFNDITVEYDNKTSQLDTVIVGDNGVFIMEIKNINGEIQGNIQDKNLVIKKTGKRGGVYYKDMYNPYSQVKTHVYRLSNYMKNNKINTWIDGIVLFKPKESFFFTSKVVNVDNSKGILFDDSNELLNAIRSKKGNIDKATKTNLIKELVGLM